MEEVNQDDINAIGNWCKDVFHEYYYSKLPFSVMRAIAGFDNRYVNKIEKIIWNNHNIISYYNGSLFCGFLQFLMTVGSVCQSESLYKKVKWSCNLGRQYFPVMFELEVNDQYDMNTLGY